VVPVSAAVVMAVVSASGLAAVALTPLTRRLVGRDGAGLGSWLPVALAGLAAIGAAGAAALATTTVELVAYAVLALAGALLVVVDLAAYRLPDIIVGPTAATLILLLGLAGILGGDLGRWGRSLLAGVVLLAVYLGLALLRRSGLGMGDVKLAGLLGLFLGWLGWPQVAVGTLATFVLGGLWAAVLLLARRSGRDDSYPFGPWMMLGTVVAAVWTVIGL
jgi:leader peptidase (prepilin peptidase) / N-methyltransferase